MPDAVQVSATLLDREIIQYKQKNAAKDIDHLKESKGAFQDKKDKNLKVNRAQEKRLARKAEKMKAKRKKKK